MTGRDFFARGDDYNVVMPVGNYAVTVASGTLVDWYETPVGIVAAVVLEKPGAVGHYRSYVPLGGSVVVKRVDPEPEQVREPEPVRQGITVRDEDESPL